jgi:hypothetical protein
MIGEYLLELLRSQTGIVRSMARQVDQVCGLVLDMHRRVAELEAVTVLRGCSSCGRRWRDWPAAPVPYCPGCRKEVRPPEA